MNWYATTSRKTAGSTPSVIVGICFTTTVRSCIKGFVATRTRTTRAFDWPVSTSGSDNTGVPPNRAESSVSASLTTLSTSAAASSEYSIECPFNEPVSVRRYGCCVVASTALVRRNWRHSRCSRWSGRSHSSQCDFFVYLLSPASAAALAPSAFCFGFGLKSIPVSLRC